MLLDQERLILKTRILLIYNVSCFKKIVIIKALFICLLCFVSYNILAQHLSYTDPNYQNLDSFISIEGHVLNLEQTENLILLKTTQGKVSINGVVFEYKNKRKIKIAGNNYRIEDYFYSFLERKTKLVREIQSIKPTNGFILLEFCIMSDDLTNLRPYNYIIFFKDGTMLFQLVNHTLYFGQFGKQWIIDNIKKARYAEEPISFDVTNYTVNLDNDLKHTLTLGSKKLLFKDYSLREYSVAFMSSFSKEGENISTESFFIPSTGYLLDDLEAIKNL